MHRMDILPYSPDKTFPQLIHRTQAGRIRDRILVFVRFLLRGYAVGAAKKYALMTEGPSASHRCTVPLSHYWGTEAMLRAFDVWLANLSTRAAAELYHVSASIAFRVLAYLPFPTRPEMHRIWPNLRRTQDYPPSISS
ncbi:hypothetical protein FOMPIDRAFT_1016960 [Fomitopsis schrenkii]|uniref:Uncharacterized protein n=1 Tax=Fomitopsis schrenkii TaxID=2126942 RepID=S8E8H0_FOMSC|nr:hypothetical protein FOMPIDRAFT_1016960 [Fomitopsis schrenkii]